MQSRVTIVRLSIHFLHIYTDTEAVQLTNMAVIYKQTGVKLSYEWLKGMIISTKQKFPFFIIHSQITKYLYGCVANTIE